MVLLLFGCYGVARVDLEMWVQSVHRLLTCCKEACSWFVQLLASPEVCFHFNFSPPSMGSYKTRNGNEKWEMRKWRYEEIGK